MDIQVAYGPSGKAVRYGFKHDVQNQKIVLIFSGDPEDYTIRLLLPKGKNKEYLTLDGKEMNSQLVKVRNSDYVLVNGINKGNHTIELTYK